MFAPIHMAVGALVEARVKRRVPTAIGALASHFALDLTVFWHAPWEWPSGTPAILKVLPYPHDLTSSVVLAALVIATVAVAVLLRRFWWGMLCAMLPDVVDWLILRPITGREVFHHLDEIVEKPWGFVLEMILAVGITVLVYWLVKREKRAPNELPENGVGSQKPF